MQVSSAASGHVTYLLTFLVSLLLILAYHKLHANILLAFFLVALLLAASVWGNLFLTVRGSCWLWSAAPSKQRRFCRLLGGYGYRRILISGRKYSSTLTKRGPRRWLPTSSGVGAVLPGQRTSPAYRMDDPDDPRGRHDLQLL